MMRPCEGHHPMSARCRKEIENPTEIRRIQYIPYEKTHKLIKPNPGTLVGVLLFWGGIFVPPNIKLPGYFRHRPELVIIAVCLSGLLVIAISLICAGRKTRRHWRRVRARCLDREIWKEDGDGPDSGKTWNFQTLCEFELDGEAYRVTPGYWSTFATRAGIQRFLNKNIQEGMCELHVNPDNPLQTEFVGHDIKDLLLH